MPLTFSQSVAASITAWVPIIMGVTYSSMAINDLKENTEVYKIAIITLVFSL